MMSGPWIGFRTSVIRKEQQSRLVVFFLVPVIFLVTVLAVVVITIAIRLLLLLLLLFLF